MYMLLQLINIVKAEYTDPVAAEVKSVNKAITRSVCRDSQAGRQLPVAEGRAAASALPPSSSSCRSPDPGRTAPT